MECVWVRFPQCAWRWRSLINARVRVTDTTNDGAFRRSAHDVNTHVGERTTRGKKHNFVKNQIRRCPMCPCADVHEVQLEIERKRKTERGNDPVNAASAVTPDVHPVTACERVCAA